MDVMKYVLIKAIVKEICYMLICFTIFIMFTENFPSLGGFKTNRSQMSSPSASKLLSVV